jgi:hypothetical protein
VKVNGTEFVWLSATLPLPDPALPGPLDSCSKNGSTAVAFVELSIFGCVAWNWKISAVGSNHMASSVSPLNPVPVKWTTVPGHPDVGDTDVRCAADAAWALPKNTSRPSVLAMRLTRPMNPRPSARDPAVPRVAFMR